MGVPMQLEMLDDGPARAQNQLVLVRVELSQTFGEYFEDVTPEQVFFLATTAAFDQRLVDGLITAARVFDEESNIRNVIKKLFDHGQFRRERRGCISGGLGERQYVKIHRFAVILSQDSRRDNGLLDAVFLWRLIT